MGVMVAGFRADMDAKNYLLRSAAITVLPWYWRFKTGAIVGG